MSSINDHRTTLGEQGEELAARYLDAHGLQVIARNWRLSSGAVRGELDIVALDHERGQVVVCEVKTRRDRRFGGPFAAVTPRKQAKLRDLALAFVRQAELPYHRIRFDVVGIVWGREPELRHLEGAF
ncbi:MAG: YraN family protein [Nitriliruptorales bacterium]|nr:YraN family protein [Nitriliruptorales bacterium]